MSATDLLYSLCFFIVLLSPYSTQQHSQAFENGIDYPWAALQHLPGVPSTSEPVGLPQLWKWKQKVHLLAVAQAPWAAPSQWQPAKGVVWHLVCTKEPGTACVLWAAQVHSTRVTLSCIFASDIFLCSPERVSLTCNIWVRAPSCWLQWNGCVEGSHAPPHLKFSSLLLWLSSNYLISHPSLNTLHWNTSLSDSLPDGTLTWSCYFETLNENSIYQLFPHKESPNIVLASDSLQMVPAHSHLVFYYYMRVWELYIQSFYHTHTHAQCLPQL